MPYIDILVGDGPQATIARDILNSLPDWFGRPEVAEDYVAGVAACPMLVSYDDTRAPLGFLSLKQTSAYAFEIYVMGVKKAHHRQGSGRRLVDQAKRYVEQQGGRFLTVKTLSPRHPSKAYEATRRFYEACGFVPIEEILGLWGEETPCLLMLCPLLTDVAPVI